MDEPTGIASAIEDLTQAIKDYLQWMSREGYSRENQMSQQKMLQQFLGFIQQRRLAREEIFTLETLKDFKTALGIVYAPAVRGFARYLFAQKRIPAPLEQTGAQARGYL